MNEREIKLIVIHCSATRADRDVTAQDIDAFHRVRGFSSWGYHFYVRKSGTVEPMRPVSDVGAHAKGFNAKSIGVCYEGGLDENGQPKDTRTSAQKAALQKLIKELLAQHAGCTVAGHRDLSPDRNLNGVVDKWERIKECPCFEAAQEYS